MSSEIVKYSNQFNRVALRGFKARELDLLMAICSRIREHGTEELIFTFDQLKGLIKDKHTGDSWEEFAETLRSVIQKLIQLNFTFENTHRTVVFALFRKFSIDHSTKELEVAVNEEFAFLLNELTSEFTRFELEQFTELKSTYAKECYRRLKQYRTTGYWRVDYEELRRLLDVPKSYLTGDFNRKVLAPIRRELGSMLGLKVRCLKKKMPGKPGRPALSELVFHFDPERIPHAPGLGDRLEEPVEVPLFRDDPGESPDQLESLAHNLSEDYKGHHVRLSDGSDDRVSIYKILRIQYDPDLNIAVTLKNVDSGQGRIFNFDTRKHVHNWLGKNLVK